VFASVGDRLVIHAQHLDAPNRDGEIIEVSHQDGSPPYLVRWSDTGRQTLMFPGPDATVENVGKQEST
jgi:hypothetical protein